MVPDHHQRVEWCAGRCPPPRTVVLAGLFLCSVGSCHAIEDCTGLWAEWSEGAYIEPDVRYGMKKLEAIKQVFGPVPARPPPPPPPPRSATKVAVGAIRWDAW
eukprot:SAG25_NODE_175_length_12811_cov_5.011721_9_plen_103_part_00